MFLVGEFCWKKSTVSTVPIGPSFAPRCCATFAASEELLAHSLECIIQSEAGTADQVEANSNMSLTTVMRFLSDDPVGRQVVRVSA